MPLIVGNLASAVCTAMTPLFHRFGRISTALWLTAVFFVSLTWFTSLLGRDSGVALNLIGTSAVAFAHPWAGPAEAGGRDQCSRRGVDHCKLGAVAARSAGYS